MTNQTLPCPTCGTPAILVERVVRVKRGDRVLPVTLLRWECVGGCRSEDGTQPFRFTNQALSRRNDARAREAWSAAFGESMPQAKRPGRKPSERRSIGVHVLLTPSELRQIDRLRGDVSRSEYIRTHVLHPTRRSA